MSMSVGFIRGDHVDSADTRHSISVAGVITDDYGRALLIQRRDFRDACFIASTTRGQSLADEIRFLANELDVEHGSG